MSSRPDVASRDDERLVDRDGPPPTYTPWLLIRSSPSDLGSRPLAPGSVFWASPDVALSPADAWGRVQPDTDVTVSVTVQNLGLAAATGVTATFWWANPSVGITPSLAQPIGQSSPVSIPAGLAETLTSSAPWHTEFVNGGHECLVVEVSCLDDPVVASFRPDIDRHVGQRNATVLDPGNGPQPLSLVMVNPFTHEAPTQIFVRTLLIRGIARLTDLELPFPIADLLTHGADGILAEPLARAGLEFVPADDGAGVQVGETTRLEGRADGLDDEAIERLLGQRRGHADASGSMIVEETLPPMGCVRVELSIERFGSDDDALIHQFSQVTDEFDIGGYGVVVPSA